MPRQHHHHHDSNVWPGLIADSASSLFLRSFMQESKNEEEVEQIKVKCITSY
jgi:hypothetical protein